MNSRGKFRNVCFKRLCIFGPKGAIQIRYYYLLSNFCEIAVLVFVRPGNMFSSRIVFMHV